MFTGYNINQLSLEVILFCYILTIHEYTINSTQLANPLKPVDF
nr:MAG TPA: hypothetical protein [Caudoviricetes sp.]